MSRTAALEPAPRRALPLWALVFLACTVVHIVVWLQYRADPFATTYVADALSYHNWAGRLATNGLGAEPVFHQSPLFPVLLSIVYGIAPANALSLWAIALQILLMSTAMACLVPLGRLSFGRRSAGVAAAVVALLFGPFVFYGMKLLPVPLALATQVGGLLTLALARRRPGALRGLVAGGVWGLACLARSEMLLFAPLALAALAVCPNGKAPAGKWRPPLLGGYLAGLLLILAPVTLHNLRQGDLVLVASSAGENLFVGNQRGASGGHEALHEQAGDIFSQRAAAEKIAELTVGHKLRPSQVSAFWRGRALDEIAAEPARWLALEFRKLGRLLHPGDPTDVYSFALERNRYLPALHALALTPWVLFLLGGIGALLVWRQRAAGAWPLIALVGVHTLVLLVFFVDTRLRIPLLFALCPLAGHALSEGLRHWRQGLYRISIALVGLLVLVCLVVGALTTRPTSRDTVRLASTLSLQSRMDESLEVLAPLLAGSHPDPLALDQAGWVLHKRGDFEAARKHYLAALEGDLPLARQRQIRTRLAIVYEQLGQPARAAAEHDSAVASDSANSGTYYERGLYRLRRGDMEGGVADLRKAVELDPVWPAPADALQSLGAE